MHLSTTTQSAIGFSSFHHIKHSTTFDLAVAGVSVKPVLRSCSPQLKLSECRGTESWHPIKMGYILLNQLLLFFIFKGTKVIIRCHMNIWNPKRMGHKHLSSLCLFM